MPTTMREMLEAGVHFGHQTRFWNPNQALTPGTSNTLQARRPFPQYSDVEYMDAGGMSFYNALQTRLEKRFSSGLSLLHSFTYGRGTDNAAAWNDAANLVTITRTYGAGTNYTGGNFKGSLRSIERPDGTRAVYSYSGTTVQVSEGAPGAAASERDRRRLAE